jgi:hypothetical protein
VHLPEVEMVRPDGLERIGQVGQGAFPVAGMGLPGQKNLLPPLTQRLAEV